MNLDVLCKPEERALVEAFYGTEDTKTLRKNLNDAKELVEAWDFAYIAAQSNWFFLHNELDYVE